MGAAALLDTTPSPRAPLLDVRGGGAFTGTPLLNRVARSRYAARRGKAAWSLKSGADVVFR